MAVVINSFEKHEFTKDQTVIKEGDDGDYLFVIKSLLIIFYLKYLFCQLLWLIYNWQIVYEGNLSCFKNEVKLRDYKSGDAFGELALLYNAPRAATIKTDSDCILYSLDRQTFNHIVKDASMKKRQKYEEFLGTVEVLSSLDFAEKLKLADSLRPIKF